MRGQVAGILFACVFGSRRRIEQVCSAHRMVCSSCRRREWLRGANADRDPATNAATKRNSSAGYCDIRSANRDARSAHADTWAADGNANHNTNRHTDRDAYSHHTQRYGG